MKKKILWGVISIFFFIALCGSGVIGFLFIRQIPSVAEQVLANSVNLHVEISNPINNSFYPANAFIPVRVFATGTTAIQFVELYVDGSLVEAQTPPTGWTAKEHTTQFYWQPGSAGKHFLTIRVVDRDGNTAMSTPVIVLAVEAAITNVTVEIKTGDTIQNLAERYSIQPQEILDLNSDLGLDSQLSVGSEIHIPIPASPIVPHADIQSKYAVVDYIPVGISEIPPVITTEPGNPPSNPSSQGSDEKIIQSIETNILDDLSFFINKQNSSDQSDLPYDLIFTLKTDGCTVEMEMYAPKSLGFFIYRSQAGQPFERIASLKSLVYPIRYSDENVGGDLSYYISAYNTAGEITSNPIATTTASGFCSEYDPTTKLENGLRLDGYDLVMPDSMELAYLYLTINDTYGWRVPAGNRTFLQGSGRRFNLKEYIDGLSFFLVPDLQLSMEVWGWKSGKLVYIGTLDKSIHRTILLACSMEGVGACTANGAAWTRDVNFSPDKPIAEQVYEIKWMTSSLFKADNLWVFAYEELAESEKDTYHTGLLHNYQLDIQGDTGTFLLNMDEELFNSPNLVDKDYKEKKSYTTSRYIGYTDDEPYTVFFSVDINSDLSNNVVFHNKTENLANSDQPALTSPYSSLYDIEFLPETYRQPNFETYSEFGCVIIEQDPTPSGEYSWIYYYAHWEELGWDPPWTINLLENPLPEYSPLNLKVCPPPNYTDDSNASIWDLIASPFEAIAEGANFLVDLIREGIDNISKIVASEILGCSEDSFCADALKAGMRAGFSALTGMPADLPDFNHLAATEITAYVASELAGIDYYCDDTCRNKLIDELIPVIDQMKSVYQSPSCTAEGMKLLNRRMSPLCLDPRIKFHAAPGSGNMSGAVVVRVTRKDTPETNAVTITDSDKYKLKVYVSGENSNRSGYYWNRCTYKDNVSQFEPIEEPDYNYFNNPKEIGQLYETVELSIPWLQPGESIELPINLQQYAEYMPYDAFCDDYIVMEYLYYRGITHMTANEICFSPGSSQPWVPCTEGGQDKFDFYNPTIPGEVSTFDSNGNPITGP